MRRPDCVRDYISVPQETPPDHNEEHTLECRKKQSGQRKQEVKDVKRVEKNA